MSEKNKKSDDEGNEQRRSTQRFAGVGTRHLSLDAAAHIDLFGISKKAELATLPKDAVVKVHAADQPPINLYHDAQGNYDLLKKGKKDEVHRIPIKIIGSSAAPNALFDPNADTVVQGGYLHYGITYQFREGSEAGVPEAYRLLKDPTNLGPTTLQENLDTGLVVRTEDGGLLWSVIEEQPPIGPVTSVLVMHEQGVDPIL